MRLFKKEEILKRVGAYFSQSAPKPLSLIYVVEDGNVFYPKDKQYADRHVSHILYTKGLKLKIFVIKKEDVLDIVNKKPIVEEPIKRTAQKTKGRVARQPKTTTKK